MSRFMQTVLGIDPGLRRTGWGVITIDGTRLSHVANGALATKDGDEMANRLRDLHDGLGAVLAEYRPDAVAVEQTFVNKDAAGTLKLGQARGIALLAGALAGLPVAEYAPNLVKKTVVGSGHADKTQIQAMVRVLLPTCKVASADAADALAIAICHAHHMSSPAVAAAQ